MLLVANDIKKLLQDGTVRFSGERYVNQTSLDVSLGSEILVEEPAILDHTVNLSYSEPLKMRRVRLAMSDVFILEPGQFVLAHTREQFNLPLDISAEYKLKSSMARLGLEHLNAGWCDPGWHGSALTLELKNMTQHHKIALRVGCRIGQIVFFRHAPVDPSQSYANRGRYNNDARVSGVKA